MDAVGDEPDRADLERAEDEHSRRAHGGLRFSGLDVWASLTVEKRPELYGGQTFAEKYQTATAKCSRSVASESLCPVGGSARSTQREVGWLAKLLPLWHGGEGVSGSESPRL